MMDHAAVDIEPDYNVRAAVPDHLQWFERYARKSRETRERMPPIMDQRYGPNPKETLDIFTPGSGSPRGTFLFIHGGYWRSMDKAEHHFVAGPLLENGYSVVVVNYDLCPDVTIGTIIEECRRAISWVINEGKRYGIRPAPLTVGGHSAGAHLAAMMVASPPADFGLEHHPVAAALLLSGLYDLRPLTHFSLAADFKLNDAAAARLSPALCRPPITAPVLVAVGADETAAFRRQSALLWTNWAGNRSASEAGPLVIAGRHHFDVVLDLADTSSLLVRTALRQLEQT